MQKKKKRLGPLPISVPSIAQVRQRISSNHKQKFVKEDIDKFVHEFEEGDSADFRIKLRCLRAGQSSDLLHSPEWFTIMNLEPAEAKESAIGAVSTLNLLATIIFSTLVGPVLDCKQNPERPGWSDAYNITIQFTSAMCVSLTFGSAIVLSMLTTTADATISKVLLLLDLFMWEFWNCAATWMCLVPQIMVAHMYLEEQEAVWITGIVLGCYSVFHLSVFFLSRESFPIEHNFWAMYLSPWTRTQRLADKARLIGDTYAHKIMERMEDHFSKACAEVRTEYRLQLDDEALPTPRSMPGYIERTALLWRGGVGDAQAQQLCRQTVAEGPRPLATTQGYSRLKAPSTPLQELQERFDREDFANLAKRLKWLRQGTSHSWFSAPEWTMTLRQEPPVAKGAIIQIVSNLNLIAALFFTSVAGKTLEPITSEHSRIQDAMDVQRSSMALVFNILTQCVSTFCVSLVLGSVPITIWLSASDPNLIHKICLHLDLTIWECWNTCVIYFCLFAQLAVAWAELSQMMAVCITVMVAVTYCLLHVSMFYLTRDAFPVVHNWWAGYIAPWSLSTYTREKALLQGCNCADEIVTRFGSPDEDYDKDRENRTRVLQDLEAKFRREDGDVLRARLRRLRKGKTLHWSSAPEWTLMLRLDPDTAQEAAVNVVSSLNLVFALIYSSVAEITLEPLWNDERPIASWMFNMSLQFASCLCVTMVLVTGIVMMWLATTSPRAIHRTLLHLDLGLYEVVCCMSLIACVCGQLSAIWIHLRTSLAVVCTGIVAFFFLFITSSMHVLLREAFPVSHLWWAGWSAPWMVTHRTHHRARLFGSAAATDIEARFALLDPDSSTSDASGEVGELTELVLTQRTADDEFQREINATDRELLLSKLRHLRAGTTISMLSSPDWVLILRLEDSEAKGAAMSIVTNLNLIAALVFSSLCRTSVEPVALTGVGAKNPFASDLYNLSIITASVLTATLTLASAVCMMWFSTASPQSIHRQLLHVDLVSWKILCDIAIIMTSVAQVCIVWVYCSKRDAMLVTATVVSIWVLFHTMLFYLARDGFPFSHNWWARFLAPWSVTQHTRDRARLYGSLAASQIKLNFPELDIGLEDEDMPVKTRGRNNRLSDRQLQDLFDEQDCKLLQDKLNSLRDGRSTGRFSAPQWTLILRLPPDELKAAAIDIVTNINLIAALVFSSILNNTMQPQNSEETPHLATAYNIVVQAASTLCASITLGSATMLIWLSTTSAGNVHRQLLRMDLGMWEAWNTFAVFTILLAQVLAAWLHFSNWCASLITALVLGTYAVFHFCLFRLIRKPFPIVHNWWASFVAPWSVSLEAVERAAILGRGAATDIAKVFEQYNFFNDGVEGDNFVLRHVHVETPLDTPLQPAQAWASQSDFNMDRMEGAPSKSPAESTIDVEGGEPAQRSKGVGANEDLSTFQVTRLARDGVSHPSETQSRGGFQQLCIGGPTSNIPLLVQRLCLGRGDASNEASQPPSARRPPPSA